MKVEVAAKQCNHAYNGNNSYTYSDGADENLYCNEGGQASVTDDSPALSSVNAWAIVLEILINH